MTADFYTKVIFIYWFMFQLCFTQLIWHLFRVVVKFNITIITQNVYYLNVSLILYR